MVLGEKPSVREVIRCLNVIENSEANYKKLQGEGFNAPYLPAYRVQVKKLTDAERFVGYSPVFNFWGDGVNRLQALRKTHNFESPVYASYIPRLCSSFARDPILPRLTELAVAGFTAFAAYSLTVDLSALASHNQALWQRYLHDYPIALNHTMLEEFPQSLLTIFPRPSGSINYRLDINQLFNCYEECQNWSWRSKSGNNEFIFPVQSYKNLNITDSQFVDIVNNITTLVDLQCGQKVRDLWLPWLSHDLRNFIDTMHKAEYGLNHTTKGLLEKQKGMNSFAFENHFSTNGYKWSDGRFIGIHSAMDLSFFPMILFVLHNI